MSLCSIHMILRYGEMEMRALRALMGTLFRALHSI